MYDLHNVMVTVMPAPVYHRQPQGLTLLFPPHR